MNGGFIKYLFSGAWEGRGEGRSQDYKKGRIEIFYSQRIYITACFGGGCV